MNDSHQEGRIRDMAYKFWEDEGRPAGRADEHWHRARAFIEGQPQPAPFPEENRAPAQQALKKGIATKSAKRAAKNEEAAGNQASLEHPGDDTPVEVLSDMTVQRTRTIKPRAK
jgi:hypothetical protein